MGSDPYRVSKSRITTRATTRSAMAPVRKRKPSAKEKERLVAADAVDQAQLIAQDGSTAASAQLQPVIDLIASLLKAIEEQKQAHARQIEEQQQAHARHIEEQMQTLTKIFTQQVETLKAEMTAMIQTQLSNVQIPVRASPSYAAIARTPPTSQPSNLPSFSSMSLTSSNMTDTLYCTIDTSRVSEEDRNKAQPGVIREAIEKEIRAGAELDKWRCTAVTRDPRSTARITVTCRDETELQLVKRSYAKDGCTGASTVTRPALPSQGRQRQSYGSFEPNNFLADNANIWQAAKYLDPNGNSSFDKIPPLMKTDGSITKDKTEQAAELLTTFFPPLPAVIEDEGPRPQY
jgi:hypothetical protein